MNTKRNYNSSKKEQHPFHMVKKSQRIFINIFEVLFKIISAKPEDDYSLELTDRIVKHVWGNCNICYILRLKNGNWYVGSTKTWLKKRFASHDVIKSRNFDEIYALFNFNFYTSDFDANVLESCLHRNMAKELSLSRFQVSNAGKNGFHCSQAKLESVIAATLSMKDIKFKKNCERYPDWVIDVININN